MRLSSLQQGDSCHVLAFDTVRRKLVSIRGMGMDAISPNSIVIVGGKNIIRDE